MSTLSPVDEDADDAWMLSFCGYFKFFSISVWPTYSNPLSL